ncbi:MAG: tetratricopeptide repeat protein, partial [Bacteroidales bacterium]|nr:tetratricopeptide repeat protein [Bacteroidales bacterium]
HYESAVAVISAIDSSLKAPRQKSKASQAVIAILLSLGLSFSAEAQSGQVTLVPADTTAVSGQEVQPGSSGDLWKDGVDAYSDSRFKDAAQAWEALLESGKASPELYCNIGDAYFKQGNYPKAILNYERALRLDPSFADARYNLDFAQSFTQDKIEAVPEFILKSLGRKMCYTLGSNTWAALFLILLALAAACTLVFLLSASTSKRRIGFYCGIVFLLLSLLCLNFSAWQKRDYGKKDSAIVMVPVSSVKSSPSGGKDLFVIHEGTKVKILDNVGDWQNISLADGRQGWIETSAIEVI